MSSITLKRESPSIHLESCVCSGMAAPHVRAEVNPGSAMLHLTVSGSQESSATTVRDQKAFAAYSTVSAVSDRLRRCHTSEVVMRKQAAPAAAIRWLRDHPTTVG